jgi:hypothetical protein
MAFRSVIEAAITMTSNTIAKTRDRGLVQSIDHSSASRDVDVASEGRPNPTPARFDHLDRLDAEMATIGRERDRLIRAIAQGGEMGGLLEALRAREDRLQDLEAQRKALRSQRHLKASEAARVRGELIEIADAWRDVLVHDPTNARLIVTSLLVGRVTITPTGDKRWQMRGEGTLIGLFSRVFALGDSSPRALAHQVRRVRGRLPLAA